MDFRILDKSWPPNPHTPTPVTDETTNNSVTFYTFGWGGFVTSSKMAASAIVIRDRVIWATS